MNKKALVARRRSGWIVALTLAMAAAALLAGCGGSSNSSSEGSSTTEPSEAGSSTTASAKGSGSAAVEAAVSEYEKFVRAQPAIPIPSLPKKPQSGVKVAVLSCPYPVCQAELEPAKKAAEELGWNVEYLQAELNPEAFQASLNQIIASPPEVAVITGSLPYELLEKQIDELAAKGVKVVLNATTAAGEPDEKGPVYGAVVGPPQLAQSGKLIGDTIVADHGEGAKVVYIADPSLDEFFGPVEEEVTKVVDGAGGEVDVLDVELAQVGKQIPTQVVSYVQAHPDVEYLAFALNDLTAGVPQALESAGLSEAKIISRAPQATNLENIKQGLEWASVAEEVSAGGYRSIDQLTRVLQKVPLGDLANPAGWHQIMTQESVTQTEEVPPTPGYPTVFQEAWHLK